MITSEVSKRYAKALLAVTKQKGVHAKAHAELQALAQGFTKDPETKSFFENPTVPAEQKAETLKAAMAKANLSEEVTNTILLLAAKDRLGALSDVAMAFQEFVDLEEGVTRGVVRSAQPMSSEAQKDIEAKISKVLNKKILLTYELDPKLLGGVVAEVGGWTFDDSIDTHLKKLNEELNRRSN